jgi:hypothetical protein
LSGNCLLKDGYDCASPGECASNTCSTFYIDADGDLHGAASGPKKVCGTSPPAGYVTNNDDCCAVGGDAAKIFPGQTAWFTSATTSCGKGWDYNCSGNIEKQITALLNNCNPNPAGICPAGPAWYNTTTVPDCAGGGQESTCIQPAPSASFCASSQPMPMTQGCH